MVFRLILSTKSGLTWKPNTEWARGLPPHKGPTEQHENHELDHLRSLSPLSQDSMSSASESRTDPCGPFRARPALSPGQTKGLS